MTFTWDSIGSRTMPWGSASKATAARILSRRIGDQRTGYPTTGPACPIWEECSPRSHFFKGDLDGPGHALPHTIDPADTGRMRENENDPVVLLDPGSEYARSQQACLHLLPRTQPETQHTVPLLAMHLF